MNRRKMPLAAARDFTAETAEFAESLGPATVSERDTVLDLYRLVTRPRRGLTGLPDRKDKHIWVNDTV